MIARKGSMKKTFHRIKCCRMTLENKEYERVEWIHAYCGNDDEKKQSQLVNHSFFFGLISICSGESPLDTQVLK